jgi:hypothetical protein
MSTLELAVYPLDVVRRTTMRVLTRSSLVTRILGRRDSRVAALAAVQLTVLFALSVAAPVAMFFLGPVVFGVAHLAADARYLVVRQNVPRGLLAISVVASLAIVVLRALHVPRVDACEIGIGTIWILAALAFGTRAREGLPWRPIALTVVCVLTFTVAITHQRTTNVVMLHTHNVIAIGAWLFLYRKSLTRRALPLIALTLFTAAILSGSVLPWTAKLRGFTAFGTHLESLSASLAPGLPLRAAASFTILFVFLQGFHYGVWTNWIPQEELRGEGTLTFRMAVRGLREDFGRVGLGLVVLLALSLAMVAVLQIHKGLALYTTLARFHGWLELAMLGFLLVRGRASSARA